MENIKDGTAEFRVTDDRLFSILDLIYPVGRIIISNDSTAPYSDIGFGTWQEVAKGAFIEGADDSHKAGDSIEAGLPNITGRLKIEPNIDINEYSEDDGVFSSPSGAFDIEYADNVVRCYVENQDIFTRHQDNAILLDASNSNPIYGKSNTVQPKAYVSHYWLRVK